MLLSIIISVYNLENYVTDCLASLVKVQLSVEEYEIIIVDDGSTDNSLSIIKDFATDYPEMRYFTQLNKGVGSARNLGLRYARGTYLWFVDGDDFIESHKVNKCLKLAINNDVDVLAFDYNPVNERGLKDHWVSFKLYVPDSDMVTGPQFYYNNFAKSYIWLYFFKRDIFIHHKLTFEDSIRMQDGEIMPRILMHSTKVKYLDEKLINYRFRINSAVNDKSENTRAHFYYSMVIVANRVRNLQNSFDKNDLMYKALEFKRNQLNQMLFTNLILNTYSKQSNLYFIELLKDYRLLPFKKITGFTLKMNLVYNLVRRIVNISPYKGRVLYKRVFNK